MTFKYGTDVILSKMALPPKGGSVVQYMKKMRELYGDSLARGHLVGHLWFPH